jgi:toxin-antitoxin system PIN domain toxin
MTSYFFPDVNVRVALHREKHVHHPKALGWFNGLGPEQVLVFCRQTQLGLFRVLTTVAAMGDEVITQRKCWAIFEDWIGGGRAVEKAEPAGIYSAFRARTLADAPVPKTWMDAYLAAFAEAGGLTLATFDKALAGKAKGALLLG